MLRRCFLWLLALSMTISLSACTEAVPPEGTQSPAASTGDSQTAAPKPTAVPFTLAYYPGYSLHPALAENRANLALAPLLYEGLFSVDESFQAVPALCRSHSVSEDGLTWTFLLRDNVTFSDGTPLTGTLAAQALNTALAPGSRYAGRISALRSITGDAQSVTVTLSQPNGALPVLLDIPIALGDSQTPLGTGAYVLQSSGGTPVLTARTDWWQQHSLPFQTIRLASIQQADDLIAAFDSGDVTLLDADLTGTNALGYSGSYEAWDYNTTTLLYLGFNTSRGFCREAVVRRSISQAIDRDSIVTIPYARHAAAANLPVHPSSPLYDPTLAAQNDYQPDALVELLQTKTAPATPLKLIVNSENNAKASAAEYIAYQLQAAGLSVEVERLSWDKFLTALKNGSFDLYVGEVMLTPDFDLSALLSTVGTLNYGRWRSDVTDRLLAELRMAHEDQRSLCTAQLLAHLIEQAPISSICFKHGSVLTQWGRLSGLQPQQNNIFFGLENWSLSN